MSDSAPDTIRPTVLVVDDTPANVTLMSGLLQQDYTVKAAINGEKALKIAFGEQPPDLILLDIMMPEMDGYEVCQRLKADPATRAIPVLFLTAMTQTEDEARAYAARLLSKLDDEAGKAIREKSLDAKNYGVQRQGELRASAADDGFVEEHLWTGIGRARSGCGAAIVGTPDQVLAKLRAYQAEGIEAFILSGYPHAQEADLFARHVLPHIAHGPLTL